MKRRAVVFAPEARQDLFELYDYIAAKSGPDRAMGYVERIEAFCLGFAVIAERGTKRDELRMGLRTIGLGRRLTVAFHVDPGTVTIDRILYGGRDLGKLFKAR